MACVDQAVEPDSRQQRMHENAVQFLVHNLTGLQELFGMRINNARSCLEEVHASDLLIIAWANCQLHASLTGVPAVVCRNTGIVSTSAACHPLCAIRWLAPHVVANVAVLVEETGTDPQNGG